MIPELPQIQNGNAQFETKNYEACEETGNCNPYIRKKLIGTVNEEVQAKTY